MRCLVTGVAGFVGSHIAERLLADGHEVCGVDAFIDYYARQVKENNLEKVRSSKRFTLIEGDLLSIPLLPLLEGTDWIFHQAAQAGVRKSWGEDFSRYVDCNILTTQRLLETMVRAAHVQRFVYASSSSVYGNTSVLPVIESVTPHPLSPYGVTKLAAEHLCSLYYHNFGVPTVSLRYFTVYGPRQRPDMAFHRFCRAIIERQAIHVYGDGQQTRDFTYVSDVVEANILAATSPAAVGEVINIAGGSRVTLQHVIQLLGEISGYHVPVTFDEEQHGDVRDTFADTTRARQTIGYQPRVSLDEGLVNEFAYIVEQFESVFAQAKMF
ncbi:MAG: GDP-mannose 4,6-dehydratase [Chloroflexota bacterium]|nr:GDP-mannose 4,6-dehydratase [Chloroflexota bacterium]